jgi:hypothetical protein
MRRCGNRQNECRLTLAGQAAAPGLYHGLISPSDYPGIQLDIDSAVCNLGA